MYERFGMAPMGMFLRDYKHHESYRYTEDIIDLLNRVNKSDNCAVDLIKKELQEQEDEKVKAVLMKILDSLDDLKKFYWLYALTI